MPLEQAPIAKIDRLLHDLNDDITRLEERLTDVLGPCPPEAVLGEIQAEPQNAVRAFIRRLEDSRDRLRTLHARVDL